MKQESLFKLFSLSFLTLVFLSTVAMAKKTESKKAVNPHKKILKHIDLAAEANLINSGYFDRGQNASKLATSK